MKTVLEIETALRELPRQEKWEVAQWLLGDLERKNTMAAPKDVSAPVLPNYAERRRRIFGDKVLPNMVLAARDEERW